jgi:hypothetical protein
MHAPLTHSTSGHTIEPSGQGKQATSTSGQSFAERHSDEQVGSVAPQNPVASQCVGTGSQALIGGQP